MSFEGGARCTANLPLQAFKYWYTLHCAVSPKPHARAIVCAMPTYTTSLVFSASFIALRRRCFTGGQQPPSSASPFFLSLRRFFHRVRFAYTSTPRVESGESRNQSHRAIVLHKLPTTR
eukprot:gb/GEZJ01003760.1/.p1 GENE.gb/GEZJ01003760.1/~~gb/GEZJ01003760.1/.p1  ORF type:complete len:119 (+),score=7.49 gb/GEZJ01003760.1/:549-905(+)